MWAGILRVSQHWLTPALKKWLVRIPHQTPPGWWNRQWCWPIGSIGAWSRARSEGGDRGIRETWTKSQLAGWEQNGERGGCEYGGSRWGGGLFGITRFGVLYYFNGWKTEKDPKWIVLKSWKKTYTVRMKSHVHRWKGVYIRYKSLNQNNYWVECSNWVARMLCFIIRGHRSLISVGGGRERVEVENFVEIETGRKHLKHWGNEISNTVWNFTQRT